ncbi:hypothetical protein L2737_19690 [Shewanella electrodiphila]|uniref:Uncharacterized protein n=1 Tax=Shewanella electrodiphila TaxID=934143 RepID=A0ABT0KUT6_9GAMM|nr:hypothetical protein [Shewanella electrodiphila]MCL1047528.1 hypothetical protein [Shewanella electrodiphila]
MLFYDIKCTACDYQKCSVEFWGVKSYLTEAGDKIDLKGVIGWCFDCNSLSIIESLNDREAIEAKIALHLKTKPKGLKHFLQSLLSSNYRYDLAKINMLAKRLNIIQLRKGKELCLKCGCQNVRYFTQDEEKAMAQDAQMITEHPNCINNGKLYSKRGFYISVAIAPQFYNLNGQQIEGSK